MSNPHVDKIKMFELERSVSIVIADSQGNPSAIRADASGKLPTEIEILTVGMWRTPYHGDIMVTPEDLQEYVDNFNAGVARADNGKLGLPINFAHESWEKAAGWMKKLYVENSSLMASVEWTSAGKEALLSGEWKCFSPEFCPKGRGGYNDPLDQEKFIENVIEGGALTNIPLFRHMKPIMASANFGQDRSKSNVFLVTASQIKEGENMTLAEIIAKSNEELTEDERSFLVEHKEELSTEDKTKFGFETAEATAATEAVADENKENNDGGETVSQTTETTAPVVEPEFASVAADIKSGKKLVIEASRLAALEDTASQYQTEKAQAIVKAHVERGAIKADQLDVWVDQLVSASKDQREKLEKMLDGLNGNEVMADATGSSENAQDVTGEAAKKVRDEAQKLMASAKEAGRTISLGEAYSEVLRTNPSLQDQYNEELNKG